MTETAAVQPGYKIGRQGGLTKREREVLSHLALGLDMQDAAAEIGVTKQRVSQIVKALEKKGALTREPDGTLVIVLKRSA